MQTVTGLMMWVYDQTLPILCFSLHVDSDRIVDVSLSANLPILCLSLHADSDRIEDMSLSANIADFMLENKQIFAGFMPGSLRND